MNKTILKEGDEVSMTCTVRFNGSLAPTMKWTEERRTGAAAAVEGFWRREGGPSETTVVDNLLTSTVRVIVDYRLNNASYSCSLYFQRPSEGLRRVNASNAPSYNYTWTSALLQVNCKRPISITKAPHTVIVIHRPKRRFSWIASTLIS